MFKFLACLFQRMLAAPEIFAPSQIVAAKISMTSAQSLRLNVKL